MFAKVMSVVLGFLGISAFAKDEKGKSILLSAQEEELKNKYGAVFVEAFKKDLAEFEKDGRNAESAVTDEVRVQLEDERDKNAQELAKARKDLADLDAKVKAQEKDIASKDAQIAKMAKEPVPDAGQQVAGDKNEMGSKFKPDMSLAHNRYLDAAFKGAAYSGNSTIETTELQKEFGKYVSSERLEILKGLMGTTESTKYMSTLVTDKTEVRAQQAAVDSVLQQFVPKWTPKGKSKFTPLTIKNYKCKINVPITPSDIMEDILGYLYDENLKPEDMPVVKYILYQLIFPKLDEEREVALAIGEFKETSAVKDGDAATDANDVMDGYVTQLKKLKKANNDKITWLLDGEKLEDVRVERRPHQYLYHDGDNYQFMNQETFDQIPIAHDLINGVDFLLEGMIVDVVSDASTETVLYADVPVKVQMKITYTEPGLKGDTATNTLKPATVESGATVRVPLFINEGETIEIDTRDGSYVGRVKA